VFDYAFDRSAHQWFSGVRPRICSWFDSISHPLVLGGEKIRLITLYKKKNETKTVSFLYLCVVITEKKMRVVSFLFLVGVRELAVS
jgi:hypothetical protein